MRSIPISSSEKILFRDFNEGSSIQVRITVPQDQENEYKKGQTVTLEFEGDQREGKIVSDPLVVDDNREDGEKTLTLIVEKP